MTGNSNVIVTDGLGNIALKTAEGTAKFITTSLKKSLNKISLLFFFSLNKFKEKLDPENTMVQYFWDLMVLL